MHLFCIFLKLILFKDQSRMPKITAVHGAYRSYQEDSTLTVLAVLDDGFIKWGLFGWDNNIHFDSSTQKTLQPYQRNKNLFAKFLTCSFSCFICSSAYCWTILPIDVIQDCFDRGIGKKRMLLWIRTICPLPFSMFWTCTRTLQYATSLVFE